MRKLNIMFLTVCFMVCLANFLFADEVKTDSKIVDVTVYSDGALVSRQASLSLSAGEHAVIFSDLKPEIDENSLRVSVVGKPEVKLFGAQLKKEFLEKPSSENIKKLQDDIQKLVDEKQKLEDNQDILSEEKEFLDSIRLFSDSQIPKDLVTKFPGVDELQKLLAFLDSKLKDNFSQGLQIEVDIRELNRKIDVLKRELAQVSGPAQKIKRSIAVELEIASASKFDLNVSYLAKGASWYPLYDARANFDKSQVEFVSYGIVKQKTSEDWQDLDITLSTAKPAVGGRMPYVSPWILRPYTYEKSRMVVGGMMMKSQTEAFNVEALDAGVAGREMKEPVQLAQVEEKGTAVVYKLAKKASVMSDGSEHKLPISTQNLRADFKYSTYPRLSTYAYLGSRVTNAKDLQLLAGRVNVFLDGDFVGASSIDNIGPGEEFDLYLGIDENVKVKKEQIDKKVDETLIGGIPSPDRRTNITNKFTIENYKTKNIIVHLFEAMPVPENDKIKVKIGNVSLQPNDKDWKDRKGIWRWELELKPKEKKEIIYSFSVEHPRNMTVEGF